MFLANAKSLSTGLFSLIFLVLNMSPAEASKTATADQLIKRVQKNNNVPYEKAEVKMTINERDGSKKTRHIIIKKANGNESRSLVKLEKPADLRGVGLLSVKSGEDESQWLYLPSEKRSRRIVSSNKSGRFLDSDLSYEDLSVTTYENFKNSIEKRINKSGKKIAVILSKARNKKATSYGKIKTWVDEKNSRILKAVYFNHKGKRVKEMLFSRYKKYGKVWRAAKVKITNKAKRRNTVLELKGISLKKLSQGEFSMSALEES